MPPRFVIICAGTISDYEFAASLLRGNDFIICADGGLYHAERLGIKPRLIVGDFDSFEGALPDGTEILRLPREKDYSDTYTAVLEARKRGAKEILLLGATGTRLDHTVANIALLEIMRRGGIRGEIIDRSNRLFVVQKHDFITAPVGTTVSLLPLSPVTGLTLKGFKYPLDNADAELFNPIWISNELSAPQGEITYKDGVLIADIAKD